MKPRVAAVPVIAILILVATVSPLVLSHSGGLDQCGGHYNRKTGTYHVHNWNSYYACYGSPSSTSSSSDVDEDPIVLLEEWLDGSPSGEEVSEMRVRLSEFLARLDQLLCSELKTNPSNSEIQSIVSKLSINCSLFETQDF